MLEKTKSTYIQQVVKNHWLLLLLVDMKSDAAGLKQNVLKMHSFDLYHLTISFFSLLKLMVLCHTQL